jgi:hypothetical protein
MVLVFGLFASFSTLAEEAIEDKPIIVINTFDVHGNAEGFMKMINEARGIAKKLNPKGQGNTQVLSAHVGGEYSNIITVLTTYADMEAYSNAYEFYDDNADLEAMRVKMDEAGYKVINRSINTVVAEY